MCLCTCFFLHALIWSRGHIAKARDIPPHCLQEGCVEAESHVLMQLKQTRKSLSPETDVDADFIMDANNPLEEWYSLEDALGDPMKGKITALVQDYPEFDCRTNEARWELGWSPEKKDFCCRVAKVGCAEDIERDTNNTSKVANLSTCITREDPRVSSTFYATSPVGTPCVFGVDVRDEGSHCIMEGGKYGSFGWCFTSKSKQSWGSCSESCPLFGPAKVLDAKINSVRAGLKKVLADTRQESTTIVPTHGQTTGAPAASGNKSGNATGIASGKASNKTSDDANEEDTGKVVGKGRTATTATSATSGKVVRRGAATTAAHATSSKVVGKGTTATNGTGSTNTEEHAKRNDGHNAA